MRKTQIKLIERARKNNFTEEQIRVLSREDCSVDKLTKYYHMMECGIDATTLEIALSLKHFDETVLLEKDYTVDDFKIIKSLDDRFSSSTYPCFHLCRYILEKKPKREKDCKIRFSYAKRVLDGGFDDIIENINIYDIILFAIAKEISVNELLSMPDLFKMTFDEFAYQMIPGYESFKQKYPNERVAGSTLSDDTVTAYQNMMNIHGQSAIMVRNATSYCMEYKITPQAVNIGLQHSNDTNLSNDRIIVDSALMKAVEIVIFLGKGSDIFIKRGKGRLVPLSLTEISRVYQDYDKIGQDICEFLFTYVEKEFDAPVMKDLYRTLCKDGYLNIPLKLSDCYHVKNCNQLMRSHYKNAFCINWNRADINVAYAIMKSLPYIRDVDKGRLLQEIRNEELVPAAAAFFKIRGNKPTAKVVDFLLDYVGCNLNANDNYYNLSYLRDYFYLCREMHCKISIGFKSPKKIIEAHDDMVERERNRLHRVSVPKDSRFYPLRDMLPKDFEWIKGGKRLRDEGIQMRHCVNSYYNFINHDDCAIYSLVRDEKRYTIEIIKRGSEYRIKQIFGYHNSDCPSDVRKYVKSFL